MGIMRADKGIFRYLDTSGDGTGTKTAKGNYSVTPGNFYIEDTSNIIELHRMIVYIEDGAATAYNKYGALAALTNGITIKVKNSDGTVLKDLTDGVAIKTTGQWSRLCYDVTVLGNSATVRWTFSKAGVPLYLLPGDQLVVTCQDDLSGLDDHTFMVQGHITPNE